MELAFGLIIGLVVGIAATAGIMIAMMRRSMVLESQSAHDFDETVELLEKQIEEAGWSSPGTWNLAEAAAKKGVDMGRKIVNISLCKAPYAKRVLDEKPPMSAMMPCTLSVYTKPDGNTYIAKLNSRMMGKMMGGTIAEVMGGNVAEEEEQMLGPVVNPAE